MKSYHLLFLLFPLSSFSQQNFDHIREEFKQKNKIEYVYGFENGYAVYRTFDDTMGVIDSAQNIIVKPVFSFIHNDKRLKNLFEVGMKNEKEFKRGFIDLKGNIKIPIIYDQVFYINTNIVSVTKGSKAGILDTLNNIILPVEFDNITVDNHLLIPKNKGLYTLHNLQGRQISHLQFSDISRFENNKAIITYPDKTTCIINGQAEVILNNIKGYRFEKVLKDDLYLIRNNLTLKKGIVNTDGKFLIDCKYDDLQQEKSFFIATTNRKKGFIDLKDSIIKPLIYDEVYSNYFEEKLGGGENLLKDLENTYTVKKDDLYGVINPTIAEDIIPLRYPLIWTLFDKYFLVKNAKEINGLFAANGATILEEKYKFYNVFEGTIFAIEKDKSFLVKLEDGKYKKTELVAGELVGFVDEPPYSKSEHQLFKFQGKFGVVNYENKVVIPAVYDSIQNIYLSKEFIVKKNTKYGIVNSENQMVVEIDYDEFRIMKESVLFIKDHKNNKKVHVIRFI